MNGFTITSLKVDQLVHDIEGWAYDPAWSWTAPDGRVVRWNDSQGVMENAKEEYCFVACDEDGDDINDYFWVVEGTDIRVPEIPHIKVMRKFGGVVSVDGTFEIGAPWTDMIRGMEAKFDSEWKGQRVLGILITSIHGNERGVTGTFTADKVIPQ